MNFHIFTCILHLLYGYITNLQSDQLPVSLIAQLVEHCTGIAEVMGSKPVQTRIFLFQALILYLFHLSYSPRVSLCKALNRSYE